MVPASDLSTPERERLSWLTCLIAAYEQEHDWEEDGDPDATREMLREVTALADELEAKAAPAANEPTPLFADAELPY